MKNNKRTLNIMFNKSGSGSINTRVSIPKDWINTLGITAENKQVIAVFDEQNEQIIIYKKA